MASIPFPVTVAQGVPDNVGFFFTRSGITFSTGASYTHTVSTNVMAVPIAMNGGDVSFTISPPEHTEPLRHGLAQLVSRYREAAG